MDIDDGELDCSHGDLGQGLPAFPIRPPLLSMYMPFLLPHEGNPKRDVLMAEIQAMVAKGAVIPLP